MKFHLLILLSQVVTFTVATPGSFWQISDLHIDERYSVSGDVRLMCHGNSTNVTVGRYGNFSCDAPWDLIVEAVNTMKLINPKPDFILWTGDIMAHVSENSINWDNVYFNLKRATELIDSTFPHSTLIPVIGNHDVYPANSFPDRGYEGVYKKFLSFVGWNKFVPPEMVPQFRKGGYFARDLTDKLKLISLNTNLYLSHNRNQSRDTDPDGQFSWLEEQLNKARKGKMMVIIAAHAPPGYFERNPMEPFLVSQHANQYIALMVNFADVILTQIFGHTHTDSFRLFTDHKGEVKTHAFIAPSISPMRLIGTDGLNPSIRQYMYDVDGKAILDYEQYFLNLTEVTEITANPTIVTTETATPEMSTDIDSSIADSSTDSHDEESTSSSDASSNDSGFSDSASTDASTGKSDYAWPKRRPRREAWGLLNWQLLYRATEAYGVRDLDTRSLKLVYTKLVNDAETFDKYYYYNTVGVRYKPCNETCRKIQLCAIAALTTSAFQSCLQEGSTPSILDYFTRPTKHPVVTPEDHSQSTPEGDHRPTRHPVASTTDADHSHHDHRHGKRNDMLIIGMAIGLFLALVIMTAVASVFCVRRRYRSGFRYQKHVGYNSD